MTIRTLSDDSSMRLSLISLQTSSKAFSTCLCIPALCIYFHQGFSINFKQRSCGNRGSAWFFNTCWVGWLLILVSSLWSDGSMIFFLWPQEQAEQVRDTRFDFHYFLNNFLSIYLSILSYISRWLNWNDLGIWMEIAGQVINRAFCTLPTDIRRKSILIILFFRKSHRLGVDASDAANPKAGIIRELLTSSQCVTSWCPFQVLQEGSCSTAPVENMVETTSWAHRFAIQSWRANPYSCRNGSRHGGGIWSSYADLCCTCSIHSGSCEESCDFVFNLSWCLGALSEGMTCSLHMPAWILGIL